VVVTLHFISMKTCNLLTSVLLSHLATHNFHFFFMFMLVCQLQHKHVSFTLFFPSFISLTPWSNSRVRICCLLIFPVWMVQVPPRKRLTTHAYRFPRNSKSNM
jgi:hypothetical protein